MTRFLLPLVVAGLVALGTGFVAAQDHTPPDTSKKALQPPVDSQKIPTSTGSMSTKTPATGAGENKQTPTGGQPGGGTGKS